MKRRDIGDERELADVLESAWSSYLKRTRSSTGKPTLEAQTTIAALRRGAP